MSDPSLLQQLLKRVQLLRNNFPHITQADIAKHIGVQESNFSAALAGRVGLSADSVLKLHRLFNLSKRDVLAVFNKPVLSSQIIKLQERGKPLSFDNPGWVPREGDSAADPNNAGNDITQTHKIRSEAVENLLAVVAALDDVTRKMIVAGVTKAHLNSGSTAATGQRFNRK